MPVWWSSRYWQRGVLLPCIEAWHHQDAGLTMADIVWSVGLVLVVVWRLHVILGHIRESKAILGAVVDGARIRERMGTLRTVGRRFLLHGHRKGAKASRRGILDGTDYSILVEILCRNESQDRQADVLHVLSKMDRKLLPGGKGLAAEPTGLVLRSILRLCMTLLDLLPRLITAAGLLDGGFGLDLGLRKLVLADEMLQEVVTSVTDVSTFFNIARPPFEMTMTFVLVPNPIGFSLEHLGVPAPVPCTGERLNILMDVLSPVRRLDELPGGKAQLAFEFLLFV